jgi:hypothetical protein
MFLDSFYSDAPDGLRISARQGSRFAKEMAGDFNPIHDPDNKRFCVPGDLMFSLVVGRYGLSPKMEFRFSNMLGADVPLRLPDTDDDHFELRDGNDKTCLEIRRQGEPDRDPAVIENLVRRYVAFSGCNFPNIMVPLMEQHGVMINPDRPLVIYESMSFELRRPVSPELRLDLAASTLEHNGKRGESRLHFHFLERGEVVGEGCKNMLLSGLRAYRAEKLAELVERFEGWKAAYRAGEAAPPGGTP